jgi:hypothetical protein
MPDPSPVERASLAAQERHDILEIIRRPTKMAPPTQATALAA